MKHIITIGGYPGSGKSSTANGVAAALGFQRFSSGDLMRQVGLRHNMSIDEVISHAKTDPTIDEEIDQAVRDAGEKENVVIDSRLAFHWIPESFKVFLKLDLHISAERTLSHIQKEGRVGQNGNSIEEMYENTKNRITIDQHRYLEKYGVEYLDEKNYDLVIDTAQHPLDEVIRMVVEEYKKRL